MLSRLLTWLWPLPATPLEQKKKALGGEPPRYVVTAPRDNRKQWRVVTKKKA